MRIPAKRDTWQIASTSRPLRALVVAIALSNGLTQQVVAQPTETPVPAELTAALKQNRKAAAFFETLDKTNRYAFCWRVARSSIESG